MVKRKITKPPILISSLLGLIIGLPFLITFHFYSQFYLGPSITLRPVLLSYSHLCQQIKNWNTVSVDGDAVYGEVKNLQDEMKLIADYFSNKSNKRKGKKAVQLFEKNISLNPVELAILEEWQNRNPDEITVDTTETFATYAPVLPQIKSPRWSEQLDNFVFDDGTRLSDYIEEQKNINTVKVVNYNLPASEVIQEDEVSVKESKSYTLPSMNDWPTVDLPHSKETASGSDPDDQLLLALNSSDHIQENIQHSEGSALQIAAAALGEVADEGVSIQKSEVYSAPSPASTIVSNPFVDAPIPLPEEVNKAINRTIKQREPVDVRVVDNTKLPNPNNQNVKQFVNNGEDQKKDKIRYYSPDRNINLSETRIRAYSVVLGEGMRVLTDYAFDPYSATRGTYRDEEMGIKRSYSDGGSGEIPVRVKLNDRLGQLSGLIRADGHRPTTVDLALEKGIVLYHLPILQREGLDHFLNTQKVEDDEYQGLALIELSEKTEMVQIAYVDSQGRQFITSPRFFFDEGFRLIENEKEYFMAKYALFVGLASGINVIEYKTTTKDTVKKFIHISDDDVYLEMNDYFERAVEHLNLFEMVSIGKIPLEIDAEKITFFNQERTTKDLKKDSAPNHFVLYGTKRPLGTRSYFTFNHLSQEIIVGKGLKSTITLPHSKVIQDLFSDLRLEGNGCLIQLNLSKKAVDFEVQGRGAQRSIWLGTQFLDIHKNYQSTISAEIYEAFVMGEEEGVVDIRIQYMDGTHDLLQTYCFKDTYLIEQL